LDRVWPVLKLAARAAVWRTTPDPQPVGVPALVGWTLALAAVRVALQFLTAGSQASFNPYGLNAVAAWLALELAVAALFVRPGSRLSALAALFALSILGETVILAVKVGWALLPAGVLPSAVAVVLPNQPAAAVAVFALGVVWWLGAMFCVIRSLEPQPRLRLLARVSALWIALFAANALVPHAPVFVPRDFNIRNANWWEYAYARYLTGREASGAQASRGGPAEGAGSQRALLQAEIARLAPQRAGVTDVYAIGVAGWASEDVFIREVDGGLAALSRLLPIKDRTLRLINNDKTSASVPRADPQTFAVAVHAVAERLDKDEDVLVLLMTSHGDAKGFALQMPGNVMALLTPQDVAATLDKAGIKNRVVIVSACYSGVFVRPLADDNTIVLTAADETSPSFGCDTQREWTYFGDALLRQSLRPGTDFRTAFERAKVLIHGWELMDRAKPSNPQGHFGPALVARLDPLFRAAVRAER
jgi:hypothetical protein